LNNKCIIGIIYYKGIGQNQSEKSKSISLEDRKQVKFESNLSKSYFLYMNLSLLRICDTWELEIWSGNMLIRKVEVVTLEILNKSKENCPDSIS
jgi:hypothetical protein